MNKKKLSEKKWYNGAIIGCITVAFYVLLTNLGPVLGMLRTFIGFFTPVIIGAVIAYIINPLAKFFYYRVLKKMKVGTARWNLSVVIALTLTLSAFFLLFMTLVPQLLESIMMFSENIDGYSATLIDLLDNDLVGTFIDRRSLETLFGNAMDTITSFVKENSTNLLGIAANSGKNILTSVISIILAIYFLIDSRKLLSGSHKVMKILLSREAYELYLDFTLRCDTILGSYLVNSLLDSLIVGIVCAVFMFICGMPYIGLISVVVAVTNLIPTFGPIVGGVIGGFIILLVDPMQAVIFGIFCLVLQLVDGYILKPKLFSDSLGVSGLTILTATIVLGKMFGVLGILLSIPIAAVLSFLFHDYFLPWYAERKKQEEEDD